MRPAPSEDGPRRLPSRVRTAHAVVDHDRPDCQRIAAPPDATGRSHTPRGLAPAAGWETAFVSSRRSRPRAVSLAARVMLSSPGAKSKGYSEKIARRLVSPA